METKLIYTSLNAIMQEVEPIQKTKTNKLQNYKYRGIEDTYLALHNLLAKHKVVCVPTNVEDIEETEGQSASGGPLFRFRAVFTYTFYAEDGSSITAKTVGKAMDSGDKDANKAMSVANKYALIQVFAIPTEDLIDPEVDSPEVKKVMINKEDAELVSVVIEAFPDDEFVLSVAEGLKKYGKLTEKQRQAIEDMKWQAEHMSAIDATK